MPSSAAQPRPRHLVLQGRQWWARFRVPADVRDAFDGKGEHWAKLNTDDHKLAQARVHRAASDFRARVLEARGRAGTIEADALAWRRTIEQGNGRGEDFTVEAREAAVREASARYVRGGFNAVERAARLFHDGSEVAALEELGGPQARTFVAIALDGRKPLLPFVEPWYTIRKGEVEPKTADMDKTAVGRLVEAFPLVTDVTKAGVAAWVEKRRQDVSASTVQREVTGIRAFWSYLRSRDEIAEDAPDPFANLRYRERAKKAAKQKRKGFTAAEVAELYAAALKAKDQELADLIQLAAYTGARREELAALRLEDIAPGWFTIHEGDAKSEAGGRDVPVHPRIAPTVRRLRGNRKSGFLFADLDEDRYGHRGDAVGKRFSRLKKALGHQTTKVFHSIRHTVSGLLEAAHVAENLAADIVGHAKTTMTYGLYSGRGATRPLLPAAVRNLKYPAPL
ncbi:MAG: tyrosine-type recombinase/integrase [Pseudomonadota bacterium]